MRVIARKITKKMLLMLELIAGIVMMTAGCVIIPISIFSIDKELLSNGFVWGFVIICMAFFGSVGYFGFMRPFILFRKMPEVQAETDGRYLYIHGKTEAKIPLADMEGAAVEVELPYIMSFDFIIHLFSERFGRVIIKVPEYGKFKLHFIAEAQEVPQAISEIIENRK